jgi:hypothetical protein
MGLVYFSSATNYQAQNPDSLNVIVRENGDDCIEKDIYRAICWETLENNYMRRI